MHGIWSCTHADIIYLIVEVITDTMFLADLLRTPLNDLPKLARTRISCVTPSTSFLFTWRSYTFCRQVSNETMLWQGTAFGAGVIYKLIKAKLAFWCKYSVVNAVDDYIAEISLITRYHFVLKLILLAVEWNVLIQWYDISIL